MTYASVCHSFCSFFAESEGFEPPEHPHMHLTVSAVGFRQLLILKFHFAEIIVSRFCLGFVSIPTLWKSDAKVLLFFHIHKYFSYFLQKKFVYKRTVSITLFFQLFSKNFPTLGNSMKIPKNEEI